MRYELNINVSEFFEEEQEGFVRNLKDSYATRNVELEGEFIVGEIEIDDDCIDEFLTDWGRDSLR